MRFALASAFLVLVIGAPRLVLAVCPFTSPPIPFCDIDSDTNPNFCDGDFNQTGTVTSADYTMFFVPDFIAGFDVAGVRGTNMNCTADGAGGSTVHGSVNAADYAIFCYLICDGVPACLTAGGC
jgi:hypothetical protein